MTSSWQVRGRTLSTTRPLVMGVVNVTPDSFSDGGALPTTDDAIARAASLLEQGADILDLGGESTRPGADEVSAEEELARVLPIVRELARRFPDVTLSIDTVKSAVAAAAIDEGVHIVNDVSGLRIDPAMASTCASREVGVVLMHSRGGVADMATYAHAVYAGDAMDQVLDELRDRVQEAVARGVDVRRIALDPGIGFAKRAEHSLRVLGTLERLAELGFPVVVGASRKRFIGQITGEMRPSARVHGSVGAAVAAFERGARILRVHDVAATRQALDVAAAIREAGAA
jgi:dihydropteroate synthase